MKIVLRGSLDLLSVILSDVLGGVFPKPFQQIIINNLKIFNKGQWLTLEYNIMGNSIRK